MISTKWSCSSNGGKQAEQVLRTNNELQTANAKAGGKPPS